MKLWFVVLLAFAKPAFGDDGPKNAAKPVADVKKERPYQACWCTGSAARDCDKVTPTQCFAITARQYVRMSADPAKRDCVYDDRIVCIDPAAGILKDQ